MEGANLAIRRSARRKETAGPQPAGPEHASVAAIVEPHSDPVDPVASHEEIARLAYSYWEDRGFSSGSAEQDWYRAEEELKSRAIAR